MHAREVPIREATALPLVIDRLKTFVGIYDEHFSRQYGFWRSYVEHVISRYLDCGKVQRGMDCYIIFHCVTRSDGSLSGRAMSAPLLSSSFCRGFIGWRF